MLVRRNSNLMVAFVALITAVSVLAVPSVAAAETILTFTATDDATVRESAPSSTYGTRTNLEVDASSRKDTVVRFDVVGTTGAQITSATLRLFNVDSSSSGGDFFAAENSNWSDASVTWNNAPAATGSKLASLGSVSAGTWYEIDVTGLISNDGPISLRISSQNTNGADYASRENSNGNGPVLVVTTIESNGDDTTPPTAPGNLTADAQSSFVGLTWQASTDNVGVTSYDIYRDGSLMSSVGATTTTFQDTTVLPEMSYQYYVIGRDAAGNSSPPSNTVSVTTPASQPQTFVVSREGSTYEAASQATSYSGTLKLVVESALDDLRADGGGMIQFLAGDFDLGQDHFEIDEITDVTFAGAGMGATTIRNFTNEAADTEPFDAARSDRLVIRDLTVSAGGSDRTTSDALDFDGGDDILIERVAVTDSRGRGIIFDGKDSVAATGGTAERNVVRDCFITNVPRDGIQLLASNFNTIENCSITNVGAEGIRVHKASSSAAQSNKPSNDNTIRNNVIENAAGNGVNVTSGNRNTITGNTVRNNGIDGILINTSSSSLSCNDNVVEFNTAEGNRYGLLIANSTCHRTVIGDNDFTNNGAGEIVDNGTDTIYLSDNEPPTVPTNLNIISAQSSSVTIGWNASTDNVGVTGYDIYRDGAPLDSVGTQTTYQDLNVNPETTYQYHVVALDASGNFSSPSDPVTATTPPAGTGGEITLVPTDDATVRQTSPSNNFGSRTNLEVDGSSPKDTLMRFNVTGVGTASVASATLRLYVTDRSPAGGDFFSSDTSWNEGTVTWNNAPPPGTFIGSLGSVARDMWYEIDVTALVSGDGPVSLRVSSTDRNGADYASKEHNSGNAPQLVIVTN